MVRSAPPRPPSRLLRRPRVALVRSRFNDVVTRRLLDGALAALRARGYREDEALVLEVPGAVELAFAAQLAIKKRRAEAVVCLGAVIRGETDHYETVCRIAADTIPRVALETGVPVAFCVLTCATEEQALARSQPDGDNRGRAAVEAALEMAALKSRLAKA